MPTRKQRGYDTQRLVAAYLQEHGWPYAESAGAGRSGTDVTGVPGIDFEVKARRALDLPGLMRQLAERADHGLLGVGVIRPDGMGPASIADWPCVITLADLVALLQAAGYGVLPEEAA